MRVDIDGLRCFVIVMIGISPRKKRALPLKRHRAAPTRPPFTELSRKTRHWRPWNLGELAANMKYVHEIIVTTGRPLTYAIYLETASKSNNLKEWTVKERRHTSANQEGDVAGARRPGARSLTLVGFPEGRAEQAVLSATRHARAHRCCWESLTRCLDSICLQESKERAKTIRERGRWTWTR